MRDAIRQFWRSPAVWPLAGLFVLVGVNLALDPTFLTLTWRDGHFYGAPVDIMNHGARTLLLALGMTLVIATGGVDLSVGSVMAIAGAVAAVLLGQGYSLAVCVSAGLGCGLAGGLLNGLLVAHLRIQPIVATLVLMVSGRGFAQLITSGEVVLIKSPAFEFLGNGFVCGLPFAGVLATGLYVVAHLALRKTASGLFLEAVGDNAVASRFCGLPVSRMVAFSYLICGACAGLAGLIAAANIRAADAYRAGENCELDAIFAVVVGGTALTGGRFFLAGSFLGALFLQTISQTLYYAGIPPAVAPVPKALLILLVCLVQSDRTRGWFGAVFRRRAA